MTNYEITFIVRPDMEEAEINKTADELKKVLKAKKAKLVSEKALGQKELAYEIKKFNTGYYFLFTIETEGDSATKEFDRLALINENILRHLIVRVEE